MSTMPSDQEEPPVFPEIRGYKLSRVLGHGGMSTVYLGKQASLGREVAIKVMLPEALADEVSRRRFENEARTIARLEHPHIVGIFEVGRTSDGLPYYAMPWLTRGHLGQRGFAQDEAGQARVRAILNALLDALEYAHARGVVHRDVKAENVLFDEAERPLLADFGIALRRGFGPRVTTAGMAVGSTAYMAPEQARGEQVDARADLYSVGVLAWEMLTGQLPFMAGDALSMAVMHAQDPVPRLPRALRHWQSFLDRALAKSPGQRFRNARQMREALARVPRGHVGPLGRLAGKLRHGAARVRRWPRTAWIGVMLVLAAGLGIGLRQMPGQDSGFFRALGSGQDEAAATGRATDLADATDAMLRPLPVSPAERWLRAAREQLQNRNLTAPEDANAYDSLVAGWKADPDNGELPKATASLIAALGDEAAGKVASGDDARATDYVEHAGRLAALAGPAGAEAMAALRTTLAGAYEKQVDAAAADFDRRAAQRVAARAKRAGMDPGLVAALEARARKIPQSGDALSGNPGMRLVHAGGSLIGMASRKVSRNDYERFAKATARPPALCRQRSSLLRILKPISWESPGFDQAAQSPVVCVSWSDADAYARWLGKREGHTYRLPTASEHRLLSTSDGAKPMAEWLMTCSNGCRERMVGGRSWRESDSSRALDATRGYDDVGFRLVREL